MLSVENTEDPGGAAYYVSSVLPLTFLHIVMPTAHQFTTAAKCLNVTDHKHGNIEIWAPCHNYKIEANIVQAQPQ